MSDAEQLESHLIQLGYPYESVGGGTWVVIPDTARRAPIAIKAQDPIVLFSVQLFELRPDITDREGLFRRLLELNSGLLHSSYALQNEQVVLAGAQPLESLDFNEFQAMIDDMCMALDNHYDALAAWAPSASNTAMKSEAAARAREGSA